MPKSRKPSGSSDPTGLSPSTVPYTDPRTGSHSPRSRVRTSTT
uniref:Uncharacterized protein n=1 Tax=Siphoviridae sp. ctj7f2 TaxID=2823593 RepID=A0A8S5L8T4_9CAUD|nr:MAG TPA: hypothetical protein [Siphoviridae sp. ctj7f2]